MTVPPTTGPRSLQDLIDATPLTSIQVRVVLMCALATLVEGIDLNLVPLLAPAISADWQVPTGDFGVIFSSGPVGLILGGLGVGWLADRIGRRQALIAAMALMTLATLATAFARNVPELLACRVLTGIGFGGMVPAAAALVSEFLPSRSRASVVALVILGQSAGGLVASTLMQGALAMVDWQVLIGWMGGLCALAMGVLLVGLPESPRYLLLRSPQSARTKTTLASLKITSTPAPEADPAAGGARPGLGALGALFTHGRASGTLLLWAIFIGVCALVSFFTNWLPLMASAAGHSRVEAASLASSYWAGGIVSGLILPLFALRWNVNLVLLAAIVASAFATVGMGFALGPQGGGSGMAMAFACGAFASGAFYLLYPPAAAFYPTEIRSTGMGTAVAFGRIGNVISPLAAGWMQQDGFGPVGIFAAMAAPLVLSGAALAVFHRRSAV